MVGGRRSVREGRELFRCLFRVFLLECFLEVFWIDLRFFGVFWVFVVFVELKIWIVF